MFISVKLKESPSLLLSSCVSQGKLFNLSPLICKVGTETALASLGCKN